MRAALRRVLVGLLLGVLSGGLAVMIAFGRAALVTSGGRGPALFGQRPASLGITLVAGFALGGALLGLLGPLRRTALGAFGLGLIAAAGFLVAVFVGLEGPPVSWSRSVWWAVGAGTLLLGVALGGHLQPSES